MIVITWLTGISVFGNFSFCSWISAYKCPSLVASALVVVHNVIFTKGFLVHAYSLPRALPAEAPALGLTLRDLVDFMSKYATFCISNMHLILMVTVDL